MAGVCPLWRGREEGVWSQLSVLGGRKGEGVSGDCVGSEPTGTGEVSSKHYMESQPSDNGNATRLVCCMVNGSQGPQTHLKRKDGYYRWQLFLKCIHYWERPTLLPEKERCEYGRKENE